MSRVWSGEQLEWNLGRAVALDHGVGFGVVSVLEHGAFAEPLTAHDDCDRARGPALLGMDGARRHEVDLARRPGGHGRKPQLGMAGALSVIEADIALELLGSVEHPVEHPGIGMVVHAPGP